ncbi:probable folate-biopterin transporter 2 [Lolium perenne]|uniref:probable folate-biopterin transporter 2 n=1 Tax=Lolium perenne TaxID=4522 RepID=UPI0021EB1E88|nr:probable folate-biopterin transporter 2 [Lolium perenne]
MDPRDREDGPIQEAGAAGSDSSDGSGECGVASPYRWLRRLSRELHWSFVLAVFAVYGACQGVGNAVGLVAATYYCKDVLRVQPAAAQFYQGIVNSPWVVKPIWGLLTDVVPVAGYRRRPYFLLAGVIGVSSMLMLSLQSNPGIVVGVVALTAQSTGAAMADVTLDALVAQNSITNPPLASDMQSLCGFSSSVGSLIGFSISGLLVHLMGGQGALGLLSIPSALVFSAGILLKESRVTDFDYKQVHKKFYAAIQSMGATLKCPEVWRPCVYLYVSLNLSLDIQGGMFYWLTDRLTGPAFSEEFIGAIYAIGSVGSLLGVLLYQTVLKDCNFRSMLLWGQVLSSLAGMLDLMLVTRLNTKIGIPDYIFAVIDSAVCQMVGRLQWLPLLVLCSKLCPPGIEGTFYALLMSIQNAGLLMSSWWGGLLLHMLNVTRTEFSNLWLAVLIRNVSRLLPLMLLFLVPQSDQNSTLLPAHILQDEAVKDGSGSAQFSVLVADDSCCHPSNVDAEDDRMKVIDDTGDDIELIPLMNKTTTAG